MANRLKGVINDVIGLEQTGFLKDRSILEGPLIISEIISLLKKRKQEAFILKVDFEKAFDSISWDFLDDIMAQMSFGVKWRSWISECLASSSISILVNGSATSEFHPKRGVRQGDPMAPFLFLIAAEGLNCIMNKAKEIGVFHGIKVSSHGPEITHLQYADDSIFTGDWSRRNIGNLFRILRCLHLSSGLRINYEKSKLFGICVNVPTISDMAANVNCSVGEFPFVYLGLPIGISMNKGEAWASLIHRFQKKLSSWKADALSIGGRLQLCKSVLGNLGTYYFSLFKAPLKIINKLERIRANFFWGGTDEKRRINWVAWNQVLAELNGGGLGIGSLKALNNALLCKWWWRILSEKSSLWGDVVSAIHGKFGGIGEKVSKGKYSGMWNNILKVNSELGKYNIVFSSLFQYDQNEAVNENEKWSWRLSKNGSYSVSSFRSALDDLYLPSNKLSFNWIKIVPRKINVLVWRIIHRRLPTMANLAKRGVQVANVNCPICKMTEENEDHLFFECTAAKETIKAVSKWWKSDETRINSLDELLNWSRTLGLKGRKESVFLGVIYTCLWLLWRFRNDVVFREKDAKAFDYIPMQLLGTTFFWMKHRGKQMGKSFSWVDWNGRPWDY